jgi:septal ring factor EnvC (AmiA/AmiB activator)
MDSVQLVLAVLTPVAAAASAWGAIRQTTKNHKEQLTRVENDVRGTRDRVDALNDKTAELDKSIAVMKRELELTAPLRVVKGGA